jgi:hypothetical protein
MILCIGILQGTVTRGEEFMGMYIDGGLILGVSGSELEKIKSTFLPPDYEDCLWWYVTEDLGMDVFYEYYDAEFSHSYVGFRLKNTPLPNLRDVNSEWRLELDRLERKFRDITGLYPRLIGAQDIS